MSKKRNTKNIHLAKQRTQKKRAKMRRDAAKKRHVRLLAKRAEKRRQPPAQEPVAVTASTANGVPVEPRDENIPDGIERVDFGVDSNGERDGTYHVTTRSSPESQPVVHVLSGSALLLGNKTQLADMVAKLPVPNGMVSWDLVRLYKQIPLAGRQPMWVAPHDGYHAVSFNGVESEVFSFDGELYLFDKKAKLQMRAAPRGPKPIKRAGTFNQWQQFFGPALAENPYLLFTVSAALGAPMTVPFELPNGTLGLEGETSRGKSTAQRIVNGLTGRDKKVQSASATDLGLREFAEEHVDEAACIEETRQMSNVGGLFRLIYDVSSGGHRLISRASHAPRGTQPLRSVLIFSNEKNLHDMSAAHRQPLDEGIEARVFELRINAQFGAFHALPPGMTAAEFSDYLSRRAKETNGAVWPVWLRLLADNAPSIRRWKAKHFATLIEDIDPQYAQRSSVQKRLLNLVASWAFAGCVAAQLKLLPVTRDEIVNAFALVVAEKFAADEQSSTPFAEQVLSEVRHIVDAQAGNFLRWPPGDAGDARNAYGYRKHIDGKDVFLFFPPVFVRLIGAKFGKDVALEKLRESGFLITKSANFQLQVRVLGQQNADEKSKRKWFYAIDAAISFDASE